MHCPDDNTLVAWGAGLLVEEEARALEAHLEACEECRLLAAEAARQASLSSRHGRDTGAPTQREAPSSPLVVSAGTLVGRYVVLERAGAGGMGTVFLAYDPRLERKVALKLLHASPHASESPSLSQDRLLQEAQAMARLSHPHVVAVHDVGTWQERVFLAMEYVEGTTLRRWLEQPGHVPGQVLAVLLQAGRGLAAAHAAGLVHRDFKPDNVLVGRDGRVCVTDFGLARARTQAGGAPSGALPPLTGEARVHTRTGTLAGTPAYMAPEQLAGGHADARSDQFSFCVTLWEALTGERPFSLEALHRRALALPPHPRVPARVHRLLARGLSAEPAQRHPSLEALLEELAHEPGARQRRQLLALGAGLLLVGASAAVGVQWHQARATLCSGGEARLAGVWDARAREALHAAFGAVGAEGALPQAERVARALDAYAARWTGMYREACEATRLRGEQPEEVLSLRMLCLERRHKELRHTVGLLHAPDARLVDGALEAVLALPPVAACADLQALLEPTPLPTSPAARQAIEQVEEQLAEVHALLGAGRFPQALARALPTWEAAARVGHRPQLAEALYLKGFLEDRTGRREEGERSLATAVSTADVARHDVLRARAALRLAYILRQRQRLAEARVWLEVAGAAVGRLGGNRELEGEHQSALGSLLSAEGRLSEALEAYRRAQALFEAELGADHPKRATALANAANILADLRRFAEAIPMLQEAVASIARVRGEDHPALTSPLTALAFAHTEVRDFRAAHAHIDRALAIARTRYGPEHPRVANLLDFKATAFQAEERWEEALATYSQALALKQRVLAADDVDLSYSYDGVGQSLLGLGRAREAVAPLEAALRVRGTEPLDWGETRFALARALRAQGAAPARARGLATQAVADFERAGRADKARTVRGWLAATAPGPRRAAGAR